MDETAWCNIENFLTRNEMLFTALAGRILGGLPYNRDDIKMEAAVAYYETLDYINAFKKTKFSSVFTWFYQKRLYAKRRNDTTYVGSGEKTWRTERMDAPPSPFPMPVPGGCAFHVCVKSFMGKVSVKIYRALIILSELSDAKAKRKALRSLFKCTSSEDIEQLIGSRIRSEVAEMGAHLYTAVCMGGAENRVVVCAFSEDEARRYFMHYGDPEEVKMLC